MATEDAGAEHSDRSRESVIDVIVSLADSLVQGFQAERLLQQLADACLEHLAVDAAGVLLADIDGTLRAVAGASRESRQRELLDAATGQGPSRESYERCEEVVEHDLGAARSRWPDLAATAARTGVVAAYGFPLRLRERTTGGLGLFQTADRRPLLGRDLRTARAFADIATIALLHDELHRRADAQVEQLEHALRSRVVIEQAKGMLAERLSITPLEAFNRIRRHARHRNLRLHAVAAAVVEGKLTP